MRLNNNKGEIITIGVITAAILIGILGFTLGASGIRKWIPGFGGKENKTKQVSVTKSETKPIFVTDSKTGQQMVLMQSTSESSTSDVSEEQHLSIGQKLAVLPKLWVFLMVLGIFCPPVAVVMGIFNRKLWGEARRIVGGVEESLQGLEDKAVPPTLITKLTTGVALTPDEITLLLDHTKAKSKILSTLSRKFDSSTKSLVSDIKRTL